MITRYPCPWCRKRGITQPGLRVARIHVDPSTVGMLQCPEHWHYVARHSEPFEYHSIPFVLEQPTETPPSTPPCPHCQEEGTQTARRSPRLFLRPEVAGTIMCEAHHWRAAPVQGTTCRTDESDVAFAMEPAGSSAGEALERIMDEWRLVELVPSSSRNKQNLFETLRNVARELGFDGEDGGSK